MNDLHWSLLLLALIVVVTLYDCIISFCKGGIQHLKYRLKVFVNTYRWFVHFIIAMYVMILLTMVLPDVVKKVGAHANTSSALANFMLLSSSDTVYSLIILFLVGWIIWKGYKPLFKYNEQEKAWEKESGEKFRKRLHRIFPFLYKDKQSANIVSK